MPWVGRYYYRSERVNGQPRRRYVGTGVIGQLAARLDEAERERRALTQARVDLEREAADLLEDDVDAIDRLADVIARAVLVVAGCHQHHRGEWRRRRASK